MPDGLTISTPYDSHGEGGRVRKPMPSPRTSRTAAYVGQERGECAMRSSRRQRQPCCRSFAQGRDCDADTEDPISETRDDVIVGEAVDGADEVGLLAERVGTAGADANLHRQLDRADRGHERARGL